MRELDAVDFMGEAQAPAVFLMALALGQAGQTRASIELLFNYVATLAKRNQLDADDSLPNPHTGIARRSFALGRKDDSCLRANARTRSSAGMLIRFTLGYDGLRGSGGGITLAGYGPPRTLCHRRDFLPFYCLIMPHRFDTKISDLLLTAYEGEADM